MNGYVIAANQEDQAKYAKFLHVWVRTEHIFLNVRPSFWMPRTTRCDKLAFLSHSFNQHTSAFDAFGPELIQHALTATKCNLGSLILRMELWKKQSCSAGLPLSMLNEDNPLAKYFKKNHIKGRYHLIKI